jgi:signal transduction histidine kinase
MGVAAATSARRFWPHLPRRTARRRLTALYSGLFLVAGAALVAITYALFERATAFKRPSLPRVPRTPSLQDLVKPGPPGQLGAALGQVQRELSNDNRVFSFPVGFGGPNDRQLTRDQRQLALAVHQLAQAVHQVAQAGTVQAAQRAADSHELLVNSGVALAIVAVLALLAGWLIAGRMLRPIRTITRKAQRISSTNLHERLSLEGPDDELKELGDTLDDLFGRLDASFEAQRHFVANASHELRTPLTVERTLLQVALDDPDTTRDEWRTTAKQVLEISDVQARLLEGLLTLASSEAGLDDHEPVDLTDAVNASITGLQPEIDRLGIHLEATTAPAQLEGDSMLVERLVANLLTNAVRHNVNGGRIEVLTGEQDGEALLSISNSGPHVPQAEIDRLFQPFQRLNPHRSHHRDGHGLGLSIVRAIATAHHATITARPTSNGGLAVKVVFPGTSGVRTSPSSFGERAEVKAPA